jgi:hypothetical protein
MTTPYPDADAFLHKDAQLNGFRPERYLLEQHANRLLGAMKARGLGAPDLVTFTRTFRLAGDDERAREELCLGLYWPAVAHYKEFMVRIRPGGLAHCVAHEEDEWEETADERVLFKVLEARQARQRAQV